MQRGPREYKTRFLQFTLQRPSDWIHFPHLLAHAALTLDTGSPIISSGWDAATSTNQQLIIQTLDEYNFGVRLGKWCEIFRKKIYQHYGNGCFLQQRAFRKVRNG